MTAEPIQIRSKIERWQKKHKVAGVLISAKNVPPANAALGYKAMQWGCGPNGNGSAIRRMRNFNRKPGFIN